MKKIILIGAGGHCKSCIDVIEQENKYKISGLIDIKERIGQKVFGYEITGCDEHIKKYINDDTFFLIAIGQIESAAKRAGIYDLLKQNGARMAIVISPLAYVSRHAVIGEGTIIMHNALVNADAAIGKNCIINSKALIEHDAVIGDNCHISTGSIVNGAAKIGRGTFIGSNATVVHGADIAENSFLKAGSISK
ncbi:MAG: acetyltransferase [Endomicrobium sp.]|jgi:sugar O-acyltransferase (sialic acid O-acetyltransferase NeuD family)|nr:acetyltransferase [Endomicrobium sp.]